MSTSPSLTHAYCRAKGICALCLDPMDEAERFHHAECDALYDRQWRVTDLRKLTREQRLLLSRLYAERGVPGDWIEDGQLEAEG